MAIHIFQVEEDDLRTSNPAWSTPKIWADPYLETSLSTTVFFWRCVIGILKL